MKKYFFALLLVIVFSPTYGQKHDLNLNQLIATEYSFAASAAEIGTRDSFLKFIADDGIIFRPAPENGKTYLSNTPKRPGILSWYPVYAEISGNGEMGFTTGPAEFRKTKESEAIWFGNFCTVWEKQQDGEFKFAIDFGNRTDKPSEKFVPLKYEKIKSDSGKVLKKKNEIKATELFALDSLFTQTAAKEGLDAAYKIFISSNSRLLRDREFPYIGVKPILDYISKIDKNLNYKFIPSNGKISSSNDLGFTYGKMEVGSTEHTAEGFNYVRVWKKEGNRWIILAEIANKIES